MPEQGEVRIERLPPGPEREELRYSGHCFDSGIRAKRELRYGSDPDVVRKDSGEAIAPRFAEAVKRGEKWAIAATKERMGRLPTLYRRALLLFYWEGMTHREMSAVLGRTEKSLWYVVFRAKRMLEKMAYLEAQIPEEFR